MSFRIMQVGLGDFGRRWLGIVHNHPSWEVAAIATRNETVRNASGDECGLPVESRFETLKDALNSGIETDAVLITTPHFRHKEDALLALEHDAHVLLEKPLAGDWESCVAIRDAARRSKGTLMIGENYRFGEGARKLKEIVATGTIGVPEYAMIQYFVGHEFPAGDWRNDYEYPLLIENATHQFDLLRCVTASDPVGVFCSSFGSTRTPHWPKPNVSAHFEMNTGLQFDFSASWSYGEFQTPWEGIWRLHGSEGSLMWQENKIIVDVKGEQEVHNFPSRPSDFTLSATFDEFTVALENGRASEVDIEDNMQTVGMVFGAIKSSESGAVVSVPDLLSPVASGT